MHCKLNRVCKKYNKNSYKVKSMGWNGLERNELDFILTDLLPVELSELFSFSSFYSFLIQKENKEEIDSIIESTKNLKQKESLSLRTVGELAL